MKLLLDAMYAPEIARQLRERYGHDVLAAAADPELRALPDDALLAAASRQHRVLVTEDAADHVELDRDLRSRGRVHYGMVLTSHRRYPRAGRAAIGRLVRALDQFLRAHPGAGELRGQLRWLK
jgi:hypothetical protein